MTDAECVDKHVVDDQRVAGFVVWPRLVRALQPRVD